jgi:F420-non-reducing hydrogenase iron-sulfur subunit
VGVKIRMAHSAKRIAKKIFSRRSALCSLRYAIRSPSPLSPPARGGEEKASSNIKLECKGKLIMAAEFEPKIIAFCCNWCAYAGADLAGVSRMQYPPNIRVIRVMCSSRISPDFVLKALQMGADGVLVSG